MKILLIQSYLGRREKPIYPIGLAILASVLKEHQVQVVDPNILDNPLRDLGASINDFQPELVGISLRNVDTTQVADPFVYLPGLRSCVNLVKEVVPGAGLVIGGAGFSIYAQEIMGQFPEIDAGVFLEAEESFPELVSKWPEVNQVQGIFFRHNNKLVFTGSRPFPEVEKIPAPDWEKVPIAPYKDLLDAVGIQTKRGCALNCAYCSYPFLNGKSYRLRSPEIVVDEIEVLARDYKLERFIFADSVFNYPRGHCEAILEEMLQRRLPVRWTAWFNEREMDRELVNLAVQAGCEFFSFSPDAFSDKALKALGKNINREDILRVYNLMQEFPSVLVGYNFFFNPPGQTLSDLLKLLWFSLKVRLRFRGRLVGFLLGSIRIEPGTAIHRQALEEGSITPDTRFLAATSGELKRLFYRPPESGVIYLLLHFYLFLRKLKRLIIPPKEM
jgi:hypothetical protein